MANIKVSDLKKAIKENKTDGIKILDWNGLEIEVKNYIPIEEKISFAMSVYESAVNTENGLHIVNDNYVELAYRVLLIETYTNLSLPQTKGDDGEKITDIVRAYDLLCESGLYDFIYGGIPVYEICSLEDVLENYIKTQRDKYEQNIKIEKVIKDGISNLLNKLEEFTKSMPTTEEMEKTPDLVANIYKQMQNGISNFTGEDKEYAKAITRTALSDVSK